MASPAPRNAPRAPPRPRDALLTPKALLGRADISSQYPHTDSSSSDSNPWPSKSTDVPTRHSRSMSNPFPSLFSTKKKHRDSAGVEPEYDQGPESGHSARGHARGGMAGSKDFASGHCMTCASLVKWPKDLKVFKCTICSTINDLVPVEGDGLRSGRPTSRRHDASRNRAASSCRGTRPLLVFG